MDESKLVDKDTRLKWANSASMLGFGMWFALLLLAIFLPDGDISETGRMWIVIVAMTYGVLIIASTFWTGYSRKEREMVNSDPSTRRSKLASLRFSAAFGFTFMLIFWLVTTDDHWTTSVLRALMFAVLTSAVTYFIDARRPKQSGT